MFDLLFLLVVGLSTGFAVLRGGLQEMATLISLAIGAGLAWFAAPPLIAAFGLTGSFFGTIIVASLLIGVFFVAAHIGFHLLIKRLSMDSRGRNINRIGGGVFGFVRGLALVGLGFLGYSYYLDEERQPDSVRNALTRPVAAGVANWFEGFAPGATDLEGLGGEAPAPDGDAADQGYDRADRNSLDEIVTTVTTTSDEPASEDAISDILQGDTQE